MSLPEFIAGYIECALWSESANLVGDNDDRSIGDVADLSDSATNALTADATKFYADNSGLLLSANTYTDPESGADNSREDSHLGHDLWLTRNGTGYWDRGLGRLGDTLADAARRAGGRDLYIGDDGLIYQAGAEPPHTQTKEA